MFIYLIVNCATGKYYVGQHKGNNLKKYLQDKLSHAKHKRSGSSHLFNSMRKHPKDAWSIHALLSDVQTRAELDQHEKDFIAFLRSQDPEYGYNICRGGEGFSGPHSSATRQKIAFASKQMWKRPEIKENFSAKMLGRTPSAETLERLKKAGFRRRGTKSSPETVEKLRKSHIGLKRSEESRNKQAQSVTGTKNHFYDKTHSEAVRAKMQEAQQKLRKNDPSYVERLNAARKTAWTPERRAAQSARIKETQTPELRAANSVRRKKYYQDGGVSASNKSILCVDTGKVFPSVKSAAASVGISSANLSRAVKRGYMFGGKRWEYVP